MPTQTVFLFDIDGVLVEPRGYRAALQAALRYFTRGMGLQPEHLPGEEEISLFEACRITSEWDMLPLALAALLDALLEANPGARLPPFLWGLDGWRPRRLPAQVDYRTAIQAMAGALQPGVYPAESVLSAARAGQAGILPYLREYALAADLLADQPANLLADQPANLPANQPADLLGDTRDVMGSLTTRIFQHFSLGSQLFQQVYDLPPVLDTPSLLSTLDRPQLDPQLRRRLLERRAQGSLHIAAYTMRPSLPPRRANADPHGYAPEAELALEIAGLQELPLIGYGRVSWLAEQRGESAEAYLKPSPVQALAAALAALYGEELPALQDGLALYSVGKASERAQAALGGRLTHLHVFEDTPGGVEAVLRAAHLLQQAGFAVQAHAWGIARQQDKVRALQALGAFVASTTNQAVEAASAINPG